jgi:hypothetical protein
MAISDEQYQRLLVRITKTEEFLNDMSVAIQSYVTLSQTNSLLTLLQQELQTLSETVAALELRVTQIEEEPLT